MVFSPHIQGHLPDAVPLPSVSLVFCVYRLRLCQVLQPRRSAGRHQQLTRWTDYACK